MKDQKINSKEELRNSLKSLLNKDEIALHKEFIKGLSDELQVSTLDCAAALSLLNYSNLISTEQDNISTPDKKTAAVTTAKQKVVRYRLDVGRKHLASIEEIRAVLIEVSGVDKSRIGRLDIRNYYSLVDLPDGMPADIFQLLAEVEIKQRKLNIKRVKYQPRFYRRKK